MGDYMANNALKLKAISEFKNKNSISLSWLQMLQIAELMGSKEEKEENVESALSFLEKKYADFSSI